MEIESVRIATFDIESENWIRFRLLGFFDGSTYKKFFKIPDFFSFIDSPAYHRVTIYAHAGGKFDFLFLLPFIMQTSDQYKLTERGGRIIAIHVFFSSGVKITFADSYCILPDKLANLCETFDVPVKKGSFKFRKGKKIDPHDKNLQSYLESDCISLYQVLIEYFKSEYVVHQKLTVASQAMDTFKNLFQPFELFRTKLEYENMFRSKFYAGGRVEVYKGEGKVNVYDVNSLFPSVMLQEMPAGECIAVNRFHPSKIGFYEVEILSTPDWYISPLLFKEQTKKPSKNYYLNGAGTYFLSSAMLNYLKSEFGIRFKVNFGLVFEKRGFLFNEYVNTFYALKQKSKKGSASYMLAKLMLNSLYGKFGQSRWHDTVQQYDGTQRNFQDFENDFGLVLVTEESRSKFILPYVAAYITDLARLAHFKLMNENPEAMFYCDTDSLFTSADYSHHVGKEIGKLSFEGQYRGVFLAPKTYALQNSKYEVVKFKGFSNATLDFESLKKSLHSKKPITVVNERILSFRECLTRKRGIIETRGDFLKLVSTKKTAKLEYDRRNLFQDKKFVFNSHPFSYQELKGSL